MEPWGPEPHFHDGDEYWLFLYGLGEIGLGSMRTELRPNTVVYTPAGVVHRFQTHTPAQVVAAVGPLRGQERPGHLWLFDPERGKWPPPAPSPYNTDIQMVSDTVDIEARGVGFVVDGGINDRRHAWDSTNGPLRELHCVQGSELDELREPWAAQDTEFLLVAAGTVQVEHDGIKLELLPGDEVVVRGGTETCLQASRDAVVVRASERSTGPGPVSASDV